MQNNEFLTASDAEVAFYRAFERADVKQMMQVWASDDDLLCVHPMGIINQGLSLVTESWRQIFLAGKKMHFEISDEQRKETDDIAIHIVTENIYMHGDPKPRPPIVATNIYKLTNQGWKMILHHASPSVIDPIRERTSPNLNKHLH